MNSYAMVAVIGGKRYNTETADLIADNAYWDGHNFERGGTNCFLFRTKNGNYFFQNLTQWEGCRDNLQPCTEEEAVEFWENCRDNDKESFETAFPNRAVVEA